MLFYTEAFSRHRAPPAEKRGEKKKTKKSGRNKLKKGKKKKKKAEKKKMEGEKTRRLISIRLP